MEKTKAPLETSRRKTLKYVIYILIVLIATGLSLFFSLNGQFNEVISTLGSADWRYVLIIFALVAASYLVDGLIILVFCRLYTRKYYFHQGLAASLVGQFYSNVTPGSSGGQVMQAYTLKSQGVPISNAASIFVMWFILYQSVLVGFDVVAFIFELKTVIATPVYTLGAFGTTINLPIIPIIVLGFLLNISIIFLLVVMSYSHRFHNFIIVYVIGFLGKIRIVKNVELSRERARAQVENFKIELRRLMSNIPVLILQTILFVVMLTLRNSVPYFAGLAVGGFTDPSFPAYAHSVLLSSFHQMMTGVIPLPGSAGVSEFFFDALFSNSVPNRAVRSSMQLLWRTATFHAVFLVSGLVSALYRSRPKEPMHYANRNTFIDLQLSTFDERKRSADTLFQTRQLSRLALQKKLSETLSFSKKKSPPPKESSAPKLPPVATKKESVPLAKAKAEPAISKIKPKEEQKARKDQDVYGEWGDLSL